MAIPKRVISTPVDADTLQRLDTFCTKIHRNRAEVMRGLLYALLVEGKRFIYEDWWRDAWRDSMERGCSLQGEARCEAAIRKVVRARRRITIRELRRATNSYRYGLGRWDQALQALAKAGEVRLEPDPQRPQRTWAVRTPPPVVVAAPKRVWTF